MAMITIERIVPAGSNSSSSSSTSTTTNNNNNNNNDRQNETSPSTATRLSTTIGHQSAAITPNNSNSLVRSNEIYIAVRDADIIFPHNECHRYSKTTAAATTAAISELIQKHLKAILEILRPTDTMKMAVRLESQLDLGRTRYLLVVANETDQSCLLGIDYENEATIGLVLPIWKDMKIMLDGDGGFRITTGQRHHIFKPVSVQAMWSIFQSLHLATKKSIKNNHYEGSGSHQWVIAYQNNIKSNSRCLHEWHTINDQWENQYNNVHEMKRSSNNKKFEETITTKLREVMISVDLEQVTSKEIRSKLEKLLNRDLSDYKSFIDKEMIRIMGQLEEPSKILDYLYLGSEWNASNFEELKGKGVQKILNVTSEIDNYFPGYFDYYNIRVEDDEATDMLRHLNDTYYYIRKARDEGVKVLVHCKKGISRSASVVVAYIMKEKCFDLEKALRYVRNHRSTIRPNPAFLQQLIIYQGMLAASNNKKSMMWKSNSDSELQNSCDNHDNHHPHHKSKGKNFLQQTCERVRDLFHRKAEADKENAYRFHRRKSWPPKCEDDDKLIFRQQSNNVDKRIEIKQQWPNNFSDTEKELNRIDLFKKFEIKGSRVRERIEDFENKQPTNTVGVGVPQIKTNNNLINANQISRETKNNSESTVSLNMKKNVPTKNGIVSNLACHFESKEFPVTIKTNDTNDLNTIEENDQNVKMNFTSSSKPPLPPLSSIVNNNNATSIIQQSSERIVDQIKCNPANSSCEFLHLTSSFESTHLDEASNKNSILKRALSYDQIKELDNNSHHNPTHSSLLSTTTMTDPLTADNSLKKCKKSSVGESSIDCDQCEHVCDKDDFTDYRKNNPSQPSIHRTCSLPNMAEDDSSMIEDKADSNSVKSSDFCPKSASDQRKKQSSIESDMAHIDRTQLMTPLDLRFLRQITSQQHFNNNMKCNHFNGFVRRRTEQLETYAQNSSSPPSNAMTTIVFQDENSKNRDQYSEHHSPISINGHLKSSKSFNHHDSLSSTSSSSNTSTTIINQIKPFSNTTINSTTTNTTTAATTTINLPMKLIPEKKTKKTYGKSHPLDKLNRASSTYS